MLIIPIVLAVKYYLHSDNDANKKETIHLMRVKDCDILESECLFIVDKKQLKLRLSGDIRTMRPFKLEAQVNDFNSDIDTISATFSMKSMDMGFNKFKLTRKVLPDSGTKAGTDIDLWQTSILLPVCTSKRSDWKMQIRIETLKNNFVVDIPIRIK